MSPIRVQRKRTPGWKKPEGAVYVGRPTRFGNPAQLVRADHGLVVRWGADGGVVGTWPADGAEARRYATDLYRSWISQPEQTEQRRLFRALLSGRDLMCWCPEAMPCHADVLLELANVATS